MHVKDKHCTAIALMGVDTVQRVLRILHACAELHVMYERPFYPFLPTLAVVKLHRRVHVHCNSFKLRRRKDEEDVATRMSINKREGASNAKGRGLGETPDKHRFSSV